MKTAQQLLADWGVTAANVHLLKLDILTSYVSAAMRVGLQNVREEVFSGLNDGIVCKGCDSKQQSTPYGISDRVTQCLAQLIQVYEQNGRRSVHRGEWCPSSPTTTTTAPTILRYYGLIEQTNTDPSKPFNRSGEWSPTQLAYDWDAGRVKVYSKIVVYNGRVIRTSPDAVTFVEALKKMFDPQAFYAKSGKP